MDQETQAKPRSAGRLLLFNLATDADDDVLGFTTAWINALAAHWEHIDVVTMRCGRIAVASNVSVYSLGKESGYSEPRRLIRFYWIVGRLLLSHRFDACFSHMNPLFAVLAWPLLKPAGVPTVLWYAHGAVPWMLRIAGRCVDRIVTSTPAGCRLESSLIQVIGQGIETDRFVPPAGRPTTSPVLLYVGRISRVKGIETFIRTVAEVAREIPNIRGVIVGKIMANIDSAYQQSLVDLAKSLNVAERIDWRGAVPYSRIHSVYQKADILINPSATGSLDKTMLEALASGVIVVTSNVAYGEAIPDGREWTFSPGSHVEAAALCLKYLHAGKAGEDIVTAIRSRVIRNHSLPGLAARISRICKGVDTMDARDRGM